MRFPLASLGRSAAFAFAVLALLPHCGDSSQPAVSDPSFDAEAGPRRDADVKTEGGTVPDAAITDAPGDLDSPPVDPPLPLFSPGCGTAASPSPFTGDHVSDGDEVDVVVGPDTRHYLLYIPAGYDRNRNYPLIFVLHGVAANGRDMAEWIMMQDYVQSNAIVVFPDGGDWDISGDYDLKFFDAMISSLEARLCINERRVLALGFSYGTYMVNHLGCQRPKVMRAIAAADGGFNDPSCTGKVAVLVYHRTEDDNEVIANGINARDKWIGNNGCASTSHASGSADLAALGCVSYDGCPAADPVSWCEDTAVSPWKHDLREPYRIPIANWLLAQ